jgi:hypothetical protein
MHPPQWTWSFAGADGTVLKPPIGPTLPSRFDAEAWLGEHWRALATEGVAAATVLLDGTPQGAPVELVEPLDG